MKIFKWNGQYSVGIEEMDEQHKELFNLLNRLYDEMSRGGDIELVGTVLQELISSTTVHFKDEEGLMKINNYPDIKSHCEEHEDLLRQSAELQNKFHEGRIEMSLQVILFLKDWLINHITDKDKQYAAYIKSRG